jgi:hypothetical protein
LSSIGYFGKTAVGLKLLTFLVDGFRPDRVFDSLPESARDFGLLSSDREEAVFGFDGAEGELVAELLELC